MKNKEKNYDVGVIIGRFQVAELHPSHKEILERLILKHKKVIIMIGVSETLGTKENPLGYMERECLIRESYSDRKITIVPIMDHRSDTIWSKNVDATIKAIAPLGSICIYGGRNSFIDSYSGEYDCYEYMPIGKESGTLYRIETGKTIISSPDFRKGIIYSTQNKYSQVYLTVDIAVISKNKVLLGKKEGNNSYSFPGGFVSTSDLSLEDAAKRELMEEIDVSVSDDFVYVKSFKQNDYRYKNTEECITTVLFKCNYIYGTCKPISEFKETKWVELKKENLKLITKTHYELFKSLLIGKVLNGK